MLGYKLVIKELLKSGFYGIEVMFKVDIKNNLLFNCL